MRRSLLVIPMAALSGACATGRVYRESIVTDRPDFTESPVPVPHHAVQLEMGDTYDRTDGVRANTAGEVLVRIGVAPAAELRVGLNSIVREHAPGAPSLREDASLGAKLRLVPEREGRHLLPAASLLVGTSLPTGSRAVRSSALAPEAKLAMGWSLADAWELSSNVNVASVPEAGARSVETVLSLSLGHDLSERVGSYLEWFGGRTGGASGPQYVNAGTTYLLSPNAQLDVRAGAGVGRGHGDYFFGVGIARRW